MQGWSPSSTRRNTLFLYSIRNGDLTGHGVALTLTLKDCPETHDDWKKLRERFFWRIRQMGMIRVHWVTEWQRRGVPHLHCAVWFDEPNQGGIATFYWHKLAGEFGASMRAQHAAPIHDERGWFEYLSKHARRGLAHYQRSPENVPDGWRKTGRMWGHLGNWPRDEAMRLNISMECFHRYRRLIRGYMVSLARESGKPSRIRWTRRMLFCADPDMSPVKALNEWIPLEIQMHLAVWLQSQGFEIDHE